MQPPHADMLRRLLASAGLRFALIEEGAPAEFGHFDAGAGVMTPTAMVRHMVRVARFLDHMLGGPDPVPCTADDWPAVCAEFYAALREADARLAGDGASDGELERILQGPASDLLHHIGQLSMMRRLAGAPVRAVSFPKVSLAAGVIPPDLSAIP